MKSSNVRAVGCLRWVLWNPLLRWLLLRYGVWTDICRSRRAFREGRHQQLPVHVMSQEIEMNWAHYRLGEPLNQ